MQRILLICLLLFASVSIFAQVPYGSNNGKYIQHRGFKMYYEFMAKANPC